nr:hypothetical protein MtrDRAFT_AC149601g4v2 [Medicago truncatula]
MVVKPWNCMSNEAVPEIGGMLHVIRSDFRVVQILFLPCSASVCQIVEYCKRIQEDLKKKDKENKFVECQQLGAKRIKQKTKWKSDNMVG